MPSGAIVVFDVKPKRGLSALPEAVLFPVLLGAFNAVVDALDVRVHHEVVSRVERVSMTEPAAFPTLLEESCDAPAQRDDLAADFFAGCKGVVSDDFGTAEGLSSDCLARSGCRLGGCATAPADCFAGHYGSFGGDCRAFYDVFCPG